MPLRQQLMQGPPQVITILGQARHGRARWSCTSDVTLTTIKHESLRLEKSGWLYAITEEGTPLVKIGHTRSGTLDRLKNLAYTIQAPVLLVGTVFVQGNVRRLEYRVHSLLYAQHIEGEWFYAHMNQQILTSLVEEARMSLQ